MNIKEFGAFVRRIIAILKTLAFWLDADPPAAANALRRVASECHEAANKIDDEA